MRRILVAAVGVALLVGATALVPASAESPAPKNGGGGGAAAHWTDERMDEAVPRDLRLDPRGLAYVAAADGSLTPHGHAKGQLYAPKKAPSASAGRPNSGDTEGPVVTNPLPGSLATIGSSQAFSATVIDGSGVKSVSFVVRLPNGTSQSFPASPGVGGKYSTTISGFTNGGGWSWNVVAKDTVGKGNTTTTDPLSFTVNTGGGGGGTADVVNSPWSGVGTVQKAAGRIYFEMPTSNSLTRWAAYVCSGTVAEDGLTGRSVIITAAHCVYDDVHKAFARNVLFIPNQAASGTGTDTNCSNDVMGCWSPSFGVVDRNWTTSTFPANIPWDYAFYVVKDTGSHSGSAALEALDAAAGDLLVQTTSLPTADVFTHALGYSYDVDPNFMYCAQNLGTESSYGDWWLSTCGLSGGSSGGPWLQPVNAGEGPIISVNSWGYTNSPGMAGPRLSGTSAGCVLGVAKTQNLDTVPVTARGVAAAC